MLVEWVYSPDRDKVGTVEEMDLFVARNLIKEGRVRKVDPPAPEVEPEPTPEPVSQPDPVADDVPPPWQPYATDLTTQD